MKKWIKRIIFPILLVSLLITAGCSGSSKSKPIRIVHKNYTEQRLLGEMTAALLENKGYETTVSELGGTMLTFNAVKNDDADIMIEYTGTGYSAILQQTEILSPDETYDHVKREYENQHGITWLDPMGFNNTYILSVRAETAEQYGLKTTSDLIGIADNMIISSDSEFATRTDGYPGMLEAYPGLNFKELKTMDQGLTYQALANGEIDVNVSFATDGRIAKFNLINLEDDNNFFPPYYCAPIMKQAFAEDHSDVVEILRELGGMWTDEQMQQYNLLVDEGAKAREVAETMLKDAGLID